MYTCDAGGCRIETAGVIGLPNIGYVTHIAKAKKSQEGWSFAAQIRPVPGRRITPSYISSR